MFYAIAEDPLMNEMDHGHEEGGGSELQATQNVLRSSRPF